MPVLTAVPPLEPQSNTVPGAPGTCRSCGLSISASARFCRRCGTRQAA
jgi:zinc ribbon protein